MTETSRRTVLKAAVSGAALAAAAAAVGEVVTTMNDPATDAIDKELAAPLSPDAKKLMPAAIQSLADDTTARMKYQLPENSEPCTTYVPTGVPK